MTARQWRAGAGRGLRPRVVVALMCSALGLLALIGWRSRQPEGPTPGARPPVAASRPVPPAPALPGPARTDRGVPAGFARTEAGAVAAAAAFVTTGQAQIDMDPLAAADSVRQMAAGATAATQVAQLLAGLDELRRTLGPGTGPITYRQAALAWRVEGFTPARARVAVWHVGVLSRQQVAPPQAGWATSTFDLVWERGDWRVWSETTTPGPVPIADDSAPPATSTELAAALDGFAPFAVAP